MQSISLFKPTTEVKKVSERGELLKYFSEKLNLKIPRVGFHLKGMQDLRTLYYIKSICDDGEKMGDPWAKIFWGSIKNKNVSR